MNLTRLAIDRLPGIRERFELKAAGAGIHIIYGPNGIGKSSICRAVEGLYWADRGPSRKTIVTGEFEWDGVIWRAEREGSVLRWSDGEEARPSPQLPASHNYRCFFLSLRDLILIESLSDSTADIAAEIRRQMWGGFDLNKIIAESFSLSGHRFMRKQRREFNEASKQVEKANRQQSALQQRVRELKERRAELKKAKTAENRLAHVERALELAQGQQELAGLEEEIRAMPRALAAMTGKEPEEIAQHQDRLADLEEQVRIRETELRDAHLKREQTCLDAPLDEAHLTAWRERADYLTQIERDLKDAKSNLESARNSLDLAIAQVGGSGIETAEMSPPSRGELFEFLRASDTQRNRVGAIEERLNLLKNFASPETGEQEFEQYRSGIDALRAWLRAPPPESLSARLHRRRSAFFLAFAMVLTGSVLAYLIAAPMALIAALGIGIGVSALFLGRSRGANNPGLRAQEEYQDLDLEQPVRWDVRSVSSLLRSLETKIAELEASIKRSRDRGVERKSLENQLDGLRQEASKLGNRRQELQDRLGLESIPGDAELVDFARALDELRQARGKVEFERGQVEQLANSHKTCLAELAGFLEQHGEPRPLVAAEGKACVDRLKDRNSQLTQALEAERRAKSDIEQYAAEQAKIRDAIHRVYTQAGLQAGDSRGLDSLHEALSPYNELKKKRDALTISNERMRTKLNQVGESELCEQGGESLNELRDKLNLTASKRDELNTEIVSVELEMEQARGSTTVQDMIAKQETARTNLRDQRDQALYAAAGSFLIDEVEQEYELTRMPRVLQRARNHFSEFTHRNYDLRLDKDPGNPRLFAVESSGGWRRDLDELSDGTRAQLLLAARIAFAEEVESGGARPLPLFLDEALDQSDPQRFEAIAKSLGCIARDQQRQIFYLTCDPLDVERFRAALGKENCVIASEIDLGRIRNRAASVSGPRALAVQSAPTVPEPDGLSPERYGAALGVPAFRPGLAHSEQHMFYVLWHDLELLHELLVHGIERAGQWSMVSGTPLAERLCGGSAAAVDVSSRLDLLEIFCDLWKQGRGRPIDSDTLHDSAAISPIFLGRVVDIVKELDGDAQSLIDILRERTDPRLKGFRKKTTEHLESYLTEHGYLDARPILSESELKLRTLATPAANCLAGGVANECVRRWWVWAQTFSAKRPQSSQD